jgi:hypothetical protein
MPVYSHVNACIPGDTREYTGTRGTREHTGIDGNTQNTVLLCIPVHSRVLLYTPVYSRMFLCISVCSRAFTCIPRSIKEYGAIHRSTKTNEVTSGGTGEYKLMHGSASDRYTLDYTGIIGNAREYTEDRFSVYSRVCPRIAVHSRLFSCIPMYFLRCPCIILYV